MAAAGKSRILGSSLRDKHWRRAAHDSMMGNRESYDGVDRKARPLIFAESRMSAEIVNLRKARKARDRAEKEKRAEENRVKFGRTKAERELESANKAIDLRRIEAHKRNGDEDDDASVKDDGNGRGS